MLSLGKLLWKILFSACSNVMNETLSPEELQWYLGAKCRMLFGLVAAALFSFFRNKMFLSPWQSAVKSSVGSQFILLTGRESYLITSHRQSEELFSFPTPHSFHLLSLQEGDTGNAIILALTKAVPCSFIAPIKVSAIWIIVGNPTIVWSLRPGAPQRGCQAGWWPVLFVPE